MVCEKKPPSDNHGSGEGVPRENNPSLGTFMSQRVLLVDGNVVSINISAGGCRVARDENRSERGVPCFTCWCLKTPKREQLGIIGLAFLEHM